jgi:hypothetical protein
VGTCAMGDAVVAALSAQGVASVTKTIATKG